MSWAMLEKMLAEVATHSTLVGKYWFSFLFLFRVIVVLSIGDKVYADEQAKFVCNTLQPGCDNVCFNRFSPISHIRFWAMQILMVSLPSIVFIVWAMHALNKVKVLREKAEKEAEKTEVATDPMVKDPTNKSVRQRYPDLPPKYNGNEKKMPNGKRGKSYTMVPMAEVIPVKTVMPKAPEKKIKDPPVLAAYVFQVIFRSAIECGFIIMQYLLFQTKVPEMYRCERYPCPQVVECFISRPMEKTIFMIFMYAIAGLCLFLDIVELKYLGYRKIKHCLSGNHKDSAYLDDFEDRWHNDPHLAGRFDLARRGGYGLRRHRDMSITDPDNDDDDDQYNSVETSDDGSGFE